MEIPQLREAVGRLYQSTTSNEERQIVMNHLMEFAIAPSSWEFAYRTLARSSGDLDDNTALYLMTILEKLVSSMVRWRSVPQELRNEMRESLISITRQASNTPFRRKADQILILIGLQECLTGWPTFAQFVCSEASEGRNGLLVAACEAFASEMNSTRGGSRQVEIKAYISQVAGPQFTTVMAHLVLQDPQVLKASTVLFEWVLLDRLDTRLIEALLSACDQPSTASLSMMALTQLLERNFVPVTMSGFLEAVAKRSFNALVTATPERLAQDQDLCNAILCLVSAFCRRHLRKASSFFSVPQFLEVFFNFTLGLGAGGPGGETRHFLQSLEVWQFFVEDCLDYENETGQPHPYAATVLSPLLFRLVERFLYCKIPLEDTKRISTLEALEESRENITEEDEDAGNDKDGRDLGNDVYGTATVEDEDNDCDLAFLVGRIVDICHKAALLPVSSMQSIGQVLESTYVTMQAQGAELSSSDLKRTKRAARDMSSLLRVVSASSILFCRSDLSSSPAVANLAVWSLGLFKTCLTGEVWSRGPAFVALFTQAAHNCVTFIPWSMQVQNVQFATDATNCALGTLTSVGCPEMPRKKAISLLRSVPPELWIPQTVSLHKLTSDLNDYLRGEVYVAFCLATWKDPERLMIGVKDDVDTLSASSLSQVGSAHRLKRSFRALKAVVESTEKKPESQYKMLVYRAVGEHLVNGALAVLRIHATPSANPAVSKSALEVLEALMTHLRRQLGDEQAFICLSTCLEQTVAMDNKLQEKVLRLVDKIVEENSRAFDRLLPNVLELVSKVTPLGEFSDIVEHILYKMLLGHMLWLSNAPDKLIFVSERLVQMIDMATPPDLVRQICKHLVEVNTKHYFFKNEQVQPVAIRAFLRVSTLLASNEREIIADDLVDLAFAIAAADWPFFTQNMLPASANLFPMANANMLGSAIGKDFITFGDALLAFCGNAAQSS